VNEPSWPWRLAPPGRYLLLVIHLSLPCLENAAGPKGRLFGASGPTQNPEDPLIFARALRPFGELSFDDAGIDPEE
jgi:hypothetical protein